MFYEVKWQLPELWQVESSWPARKREIAKISSGWNILNQSYHEHLNYYYFMKVFQLTHMCIKSKDLSPKQKRTKTKYLRLT